MKVIYTNNKIAKRKGDTIPAYWITKDGKVFNGEKYMKPYMGGRYPKVVLKINDKPTMKYIHRLVAEAFIPNPNAKATVNHIDGNKQNNDISNLEWATQGENNKHSFDTGLKVPYDRRGKKNPNYKHGKRMQTI
tara:strand:+ start:63 stop:464 length:402 start_codon:yes stop_codon:yes gene_type:complete